MGLARRFRLLVIGSVALISLLAEEKDSIPVSLRAGWNSIQEASLKADLTFLSSDALQGRLSLQPGDDAAIQWIAAEFAKAGLKPAAGNNSYLQPVDLIEYRADRARSSMTFTRGGQETTWKFPDAYGAFPSDVDLSGDVVFAGYGITAPELGYDDYRDLDVKGKLVLIFDHEPQETDAASRFNGTGNTRYATSRVKVLNAQAHGAIGVLIVGEPNRKHPSNQERVARIGGSLTRTTPLPSQALADDSLHTPAATISDAVAAELMKPLGSTPAEVQALIDRDLKPQSHALLDTRVGLHFRNQSEHTGTTYERRWPLTGQRPPTARRRPSSSVLITTTTA